MHVVYILQSEKNNRYYIRSTNDLGRRFIEHNSSKVKSTKAYVPRKLIHKEIFPTKREASKRELQLKSWKKRSAIERLLASSSSG